jgi:hypothetical protein
MVAPSGINAGCCPVDKSVDNFYLWISLWITSGGALPGKKFRFTVGIRCRGEREGMG